MDSQRICHYLVGFLHTPIRIFDAGGRQTAVYFDNGEQPELIARDEGFCRQLLTDPACGGRTDPLWGCHGGRDGLCSWPLLPAGLYCCRSVSAKETRPYFQSTIPSAQDINGNFYQRRTDAV